MKAPKDWTLGDLMPVEYNPRKISAEQADALRHTISGFGFLQPLVVNTHPGREGRLVGGEQRWRQLTALHGPEAAVPEIIGRDPETGEELRQPGVVFVRLGIDRERELNVRLNRIGGEWDWQKLDTFEKQDLLDWGFQTFDFKRPTKLDLPLEGAGEDDGDGGEDGEGTGAPPPDAGRMAYLFCTPESHAQLVADLEKLQAKHGTDNPTDTICAMMRAAAATVITEDSEHEEEPQVAAAGA